MVTRPINFKIYFKALNYNNVVLTHNREWWNKMNSPDVDPNTNGKLVYDKGGISNHWNEDREELMILWQLIAIWKKIKLDSYFTPYTE